MPRPKRKSTTSQSYAEEGSVSPLSPPPSEILPPTPSLQRRRSSRAAVLTKQESTDSYTNGIGALASPSPSSASGQDISMGPPPAPPKAKAVNGKRLKAVKTKMAKAGKAVDEVVGEVITLQKEMKRASKKQKVVVEDQDHVKSEADDTATVANVAPVRAAPAKKKAATPKKKMAAQDEDLDQDNHLEPPPGVNEVDLEEDGNEEVANRGAGRPPAVNSDYLPLPWTGKLGYACLNTYLRTSKPAVFSSRTCRIASILEHRHPLADPSQPEHAIKNRPDKEQPASIERGKRYVENLALANVMDVSKMLRWNDKYGIKFLRLSSEMFPFASHAEYGYRLAPFAADALADVGKVVAELGHRVTTHPGQFTQLGSPRNEVITNAVRDLEYHDEMLSLLKLPPQQDRDAVMILHLGGTFGDKQATIDRFRHNYTTLLTDSIKKRLVLENDDVSWSVHDLLPVCEELNIPMVLDYHHHNIVFDAAQIREGTHDIAQPEISERITATWKRKNITQKMHYSEPCAGMVTPRDRRKHSPRVMTLPPVPPGVDLMIEAKDKEQAVFELMRTFRLPGHERIHDIIPHEREDEDKPVKKVAATKKKKQTPKKKVKKVKNEDGEDDDMEDVTAEPEEAEPPPPPPVKISEADFAMGGPEGRVYWPLGREDWLKPPKREVKPKAAVKGPRGPKSLMNKVEDEEDGDVKEEEDEDEE